MSETLHLAAREGNVSELAALLEEAGNDPNGYSQSGLTPLQVAATCSNPEVINLLLEKGANIDQQAEKESVYDGYSAVHFASERSSSAQILSLLLQKGASSNLQDALGRYPLHVACLKGNLAAVEILSARLGDDTLNSHDIHGRTPLMLACSQGHAHVVQHLLTKEGLEKDRVDNDGNSGLHHCFQVQSQQLFNYNYPLLDGHYQAAFEMVKAGALLQLKNNDGDAALDVIHDSLAQLLEVLSKEREKFQDVRDVEELISLEEEELNERQVGGEVAALLLNAIAAYSKVKEREIALRKSRGSCPFIDSSCVPDIRKFKGLDLSQFNRTFDFGPGALKPDHLQFGEYQQMTSGKGEKGEKGEAKMGVCPMGFVGEMPKDHASFASSSPFSAPAASPFSAAAVPPSSQSALLSVMSSVAVPLSVSLLAAGVAFVAMRYRV